MLSYVYICLLRCATLTHRQRRPTRRMLHDVIILIYFSNLFHKNSEHHQKHFFSIFPRKGTLTRARDRDGGGDNKSQNIP